MDDLLSVKSLTSSFGVTFSSSVNAFYEWDLITGVPLGGISPYLEIDELKSFNLFYSTDSVSNIVPPSLPLPTLVAISRIS